MALRFLSQINGRARASMKKSPGESAGARGVFGWGRREPSESTVQSYAARPIREIPVKPLRRIPFAAAWVPPNLPRRLLNWLHNRMADLSPGASVHRSWPELRQGAVAYLVVTLLV